MPVICNKRHYCQQAYCCGGTKPHEPCDQFGEYPFDFQAKCEEIPEIVEEGDQ